MESGAKSTRADNWIQTFEDHIFEGGREKIRQMRSQKHQQRHEYAKETAADQEETLDTDQSSVIDLHPLDISAGERRCCKQQTLPWTL